MPDSGPTVSPDDLAQQIDAKSKAHFGPDPFRLLRGTGRGASESR
jgi:hypothetical protein